MSMRRFVVDCIAFIFLGWIYMHIDTVSQCTLTLCLAPVSRNKCRYMHQVSQLCFDKHQGPVQAVPCLIVARRWKPDESLSGMGTDRNVELSNPLVARPP